MGFAYVLINCDLGFEEDIISQLKKFHYCPHCDELLCQLNSDITGNFRGWCGNCKSIWSLPES